MIVSTRDPNGVTPFEVRGLPGLFPCTLEEWVEATGLTEATLEAHNDAVEVIDEADPTPAAGTHTASAETASDITAAVTRKKDN